MPGLDEWKSKLKWQGDDGFQRGGLKLSPGKRKFLWEFITKGLRTPTMMTDLKASDFPCPEDDFERLCEKDPSYFETVIKDRIKKLKLGSLAGPLPDGMRSKYLGKGVVHVPQFVVKQPGKDRLVFDFSREPERNRNRKQGDPKMSLNSYYEAEDKSCSYDSIQDKAAFCVAYDASGTYDLSGFYCQCRADEGLRRFQVNICPLGDGKYIYVLSCGVLFGLAAAPAHCATGNQLMHEALGNTQPDVFSTASFNKPESINLCWETGDWRKLLKEKKPSQKNLPFTYREGVFAAKWKCRELGRIELPTTLIHIDDSIIGAVRQFPLNATQKAEARKCQGIKMLREHHVILKDAKTTKGDTITVYAGTELHHDTNKMTLTDEKWASFDKSIQAIMDPLIAVTVLQVMIACGVASHASSLFPCLRVYLTPICRHVGVYVWMYNTKHFRWKTVKDLILKVPEYYLDLLSKGWEKAKAQHFAICRQVLATKADATLEISCDAAGLAEARGFPAGLGAIVHRRTPQAADFTHEYFAVDIPSDHEMSRWRIEMLEAITVLIALSLWARYGDIVYIHEDNGVVIPALAKFKARTTLPPFVILLAELCDKLGLIIVPEYTNTKQILADPLSRWTDPTQEAHFIEKCGIWGVDPNNTKRRLFNLSDKSSGNWMRWFLKWKEVEWGYGPPPFIFFLRTQECDIKFEEPRIESIAVAANFDLLGGDLH